MLYTTTTYTRIVNLSLTDHDDDQRATRVPESPAAGPEAAWGMNAERPGIVIVSCH
jgi:hypothetical protein